ncbi:MAG: DUF5615 family PIN-like protein [Nitrososphaerota archaeon]
MKNNMIFHIFKFLSDESFFIRIVQALREKGFDIVSTLEISFGLTDKEVINLAKRQERIIITLDADFGKFVSEEHDIRGIILLKLIKNQKR